MSAKDKAPGTTPEGARLTGHGVTDDEPSTEGHTIRVGKDAGPDSLARGKGGIADDEGVGPDGSRGRSVVADDEPGPDETARIKF